MFCKKCGANIPDGSVFCDVCGTRQGTATPPDESVMPQPQPIPQQTQPQPAYQQPEPMYQQMQPQPPKSHKGLIIALIVIGVVLITVITVVGVLLVKSQNDKSSTATTQETAVNETEPVANDNTPVPASPAKEENKDITTQKAEDQTTSEIDADSESGPYGNPKIEETVIFDSDKASIKATGIRIENNDICLDMEVDNKMSEDLYIRFYAGFINNTAISCYLSDTIEAGKTGNAVMYFRDYSLDFNEIREVGDIDVSLFGRDEEYNTLFETGLVNIPTNLHGKVDQTFNAKGEELDITWAEGDEDDIKISLMDKYYKPGEIIDDSWMFCFAVENNSKNNTYTFGPYNLKVDDGSSDLIESKAGYIISTLYPGTRGVIVYLVDQTVLKEEGIGTPIEFFDDINVYKSLDTVDDDQVGYAHFRVNVE